MLAGDKSGSRISRSDFLFFNGQGGGKPWGLGIVAAADGAKE